MDFGFLTKVLDRASGLGKWPFIGAIFSIALSHWDVIRLESQPLVLDGLYVYVLINTLGVAAYLYEEHHNQTAHGKQCPKCGRIMRAIPQYECSQCGKLEFNKVP
jgi:ribosomal protein S27AE